MPTLTKNGWEKMLRRCVRGKEYVLRNVRERMARRVIFLATFRLPVIGEVWLVKPLKAASKFRS